MKYFLAFLVFLTLFTEGVLGQKFSQMQTARPVNSTPILGGLNDNQRKFTFGEIKDSVNIFYPTLVTGLVENNNVQGYRGYKIRETNGRVSYVDMQGKRYTIDSISSGGTTNITANNGVKKTGENLSLGGQLLADVVFSGAVGNNLVTNGDFSAGLTGWRNTARWAVSGGKLTKTNNQIYRDTLIQDLNIELDSVYIVNYTISNYQSGAVSLNVGGVYSQLRKANGTFADTIVATKAAGVYVQDDFPFSMEIDDISVRKLSVQNIKTDGHIQASNLLLRGTIKTAPNRPILIGYWEGGTSVGIDTWYWEPTLPLVSIGHNTAKRGHGVFLGAGAGRNQGVLGYSTLVGVDAGRDNVIGHLTALGTGAAKTANNDGVVVGDEAAGNANPLAIQNVHGYYSAHNAQVSMSAFGHESLRLATTGENSAFGYRIGRNLTTGLISAGMGLEAAYFLTTGSGIFLGRYSGGSSADAGNNPMTEDTQMLLIGDGTGKNTPSILTNSIGIGHGVKVTKSNQIILGGFNHAETLLYGKVGLNTTSPTLQFTSVSSTNAPDGAHYINTSTGTSAQASLLLQSGSNTGAMRVYNQNHSVWANVLRFDSPASTVFWSEGNSYTDFYTNGSRRLRISGSGNTTITGNTLFGTDATATAATRLEVRSGDAYISTAAQGVILKSNGGNCFRITVNDAGTLVTTSVTCPN